MTRRDKIALLRSLAEGGLSIEDIQIKKAIFWVTDNKIGLYRCNELQIQGFTKEQFEQWKKENRKYDCVVINVQYTEKAKLVSNEKDIEL